MQWCDAMKNDLTQLTAVLQIPICEIDAINHADLFRDAKQLLRNSQHYCFVVSTNSGSNKLRNIRNLNKSTSMLKRLEMELCKDDPSIEASRIGIYPSLSYPACVYELGTTADCYVSDNVLPCTGRGLLRTIKRLISSLVGANTAVGGMGLILYKG